MRPFFGNERAGHRREEQSECHHLLSKAIWEDLPRIIPKVVMDDQSFHLEFEFDRTGSISPNINDLLCAVNKEAGRQNKSAVVVFDEFQEIANFDDDEIERKMRSVFQNHRNVSYIFMGSKTHLMRDMVYDLFFKKWIRRIW